MVVSPVVRPYIPQFFHVVVEHVSVQFVWVCILQLLGGVVVGKVGPPCLSHCSHRLPQGWRLPGKNSLND